MATYTSLINSVLTRLREDNVSGPSESSYALLMGEFVNETKREVEDAWKWTALRETISVNTVASTAEYSLTGAGERWKLQDPKHSVYNSTDLSYLRKANAAWVKRAALENTAEAAPVYYYFEGVDASGDPQVTFHGVPDGIYAIDFNVVVPQDDFTLGTEVLSVPAWPIILGAYAKAIAERGEDSGRSHGEALSKYAASLSDAVAIDVSRTEDEDTWNVQ